MMKRIILISIIISNGLLVGCNKFLEEIPKSSLAASNFYKTQKDAEAGVIYAYGDLPSIYSWNYCLVGDIASDNFQLTTAGSGSGTGAFGLFAWNSSTQNLQSIWYSHYGAIANANAIIEQIPTIEGDKTYLNQLLGEVLFLRALYYFNLSRIFGDVPLILKLLTVADDLHTTKVPRAEIYNQIISDLNIAIGLLPDRSLNQGRTNAYAAKALLARVYLTRASSTDAIQDYEQVKSICLDIEANGGYRMLDSYLDVFRSSNEFNAESIFEVQFDDIAPNIARNPLNQQLLPLNFSNPVTVWQAQPSAKLASIIEEGDERLLLVASDTTITGIQLTGGRWLTKYQDVEAFGLDMNLGANMYVLRYADVLLMLAEAENELNGPSTAVFDAVNTIRIRAGLDSLAASDYTEETLRDAILKERQIEFVGEGHRWFDLVRTNTLVSTMHDLGFTNVDERRTIFPIPQAELDANPNMTQNNGYN